MTLPDAEKVMTSLERWGPRIVPLSAAGTCLCLIGFAYLQVQVSDQASAGSRARELQVQRQPISLKVYVDAERRGVITRADLACFRSSAKCPPVNTP